MCGIVGGVADRNITPILLEGLKQLEYRGYDSAGIAIIDENQNLERKRAKGKIKALEFELPQSGMPGKIGIAHTRWATHGKPSKINAHPHICKNQIGVVHNGIIENYAALRDMQIENQHEFTSETDTEVIGHLVYDCLAPNNDLLTAVLAATKKFEGAFALGVVSADEPDTLVAARQGSPLVIGIGEGEYFIASDVMALIAVTQRFIFLLDGDVAKITRQGVKVFDQSGVEVDRPISQSELKPKSVNKGKFRHYMLKEIYEQPVAIADTLEGRISGNRVMEAAFGPQAAEIFSQVQGVHIVACGTSFHAGLVAKYWMESYACIPCSVEVASEFRYRNAVVRRNSLIVAISQSGETADTLAALKEAKLRGFGYSMSICNVPESSIVREADLSLMTRAGPEVGVASTKAFTTQLVALMLLMIVLGRRHGLSESREQELVSELIGVPEKINKTLELNNTIKELSSKFADKSHALFLGRGAHYPIAMEGALKLKEISYIHAEAYPAGELKHGPLALIDASVPVIAVAPNNDLLEKLQSNLMEVSARGGQLIVFADKAIKVQTASNSQIIHVLSVDDSIAPIIYTVVLQLLSYHVAVIKGTDIDQPRNLAKSVTVE